MQQTLELVARFREHDKDTPLILMGYTNPIESMGYEASRARLRKGGGDGAIIVDLPPEEDSALARRLRRSDLSIIRLATPTTDDNAPNQRARRRVRLHCIMSLSPA